jgi:hypothetical protein
LNEHVAFKSLKTCKERKQSKQSGPPWFFLTGQDLKQWVWVKVGYIWTVTFLEFSFYWLSLVGKNPSEVCVGSTVR